MIQEIPIWKLAQFQPRQVTAYNTLLFNDTECKYLLYGGAAGGGKSYCMRWLAVSLGCYYYMKYGITGVPIGLFSEDYPTLRDRQIIKIKREFPPWLGRLRETQSEGFAFQANPEYGGWVIMLRNLDDPSKYSSVEFAAILVEELTKNPRQTFDDLRSRMRFPGIPDPKFVGATNPGEIGHGWVKRLWVKPDTQNPDIEQEKFFFVPALYTDNKYIDQSYENQLEAISDPQKRSALKEGNWDIFAGQMFEEYREQRLIEGRKIDWHVTDDAPFDIHDAKAKVISFDWGYNEPGAAHWTAVGPENQWGVTHLYVYREIHQNKKTPRVWAQQIAIYLKYDPVTLIVLPHDCFSTPRGEQSIADTFKEEFKKAGIRVTIIPGDTMKSGARLNRVAMTHQFLEEAPDGKPYMQIASRCNSLRQTLPELVRDENRPEDVKQYNDHDYDSLSLGLITIKSHYSINSGPVKQRGPGTSTITPWKQNGNQVQTIDFAQKLAQNKRITPDRPSLPIK